MKAVAKALFVAAAFATAGTASAQVVFGKVDSNNEKAKINQKQAGLLNKQAASIGSVNSGVVFGEVKTNNKGAEINQSQAGLLNKQEAHIGSVGK
jgi:hypothetical protein